MPFDPKAYLGEEEFNPAQYLGFDEAYAEYAKKFGIDQDPKNPKHFYDYEKLFLEEGKIEPDETGHLPSKYKLPGHPDLIKEGIDTRTGEPPRPMDMPPARSEVPEDTRVLYEQLKEKRALTGATDVINVEEQVLDNDRKEWAERHDKLAQGLGWMYNYTAGTINFVRDNLKNLDTTSFEQIAESSEDRTIQGFGKAIGYYLDALVPSRLIWRASGKKVMDKIDPAINEFVDHTFKIAEDYAVEKPYDHLKVNGLLQRKMYPEAWDLILRQSIRSVPTTIIAMAGYLSGHPEVSMLAMGIPSYGEKLYQLDKQAEEDARLRDLSEGMKRLNAFLTAFSEAGSEQIGAALEMGALTSVMAKAVGKSILGKLLSVGIGWGISGFEEGIEEGINQLVVNLIDNITGVKDDWRLFDNVWEAIVSGTATGLLFEGPSKISLAATEVMQHPIEMRKENLAGITTGRHQLDKVNRDKLILDIQKLDNSFKTAVEAGNIDEATRTLDQYISIISKANEKGTLDSKEVAGMRSTIDQLYKMLDDIKNAPAEEVEGEIIDKEDKLNGLTLEEAKAHIKGNMSKWVTGLGVTDGEFTISDAYDELHKLSEEIEQAINDGVDKKTFTDAFWAKVSSARENAGKENEYYTHALHGIEELGKNSLNRFFDERWNGRLKQTLSEIIEERLQEEEKAKPIGKETQATPTEGESRDFISDQEEYQEDLDIEDGQINLVHYGPHILSRNIISPRKAGANKYSEKTFSVWGMQRNFYYVKDADAETIVKTGKKRYDVKVPAKDIYPFNADPLNFYDEVVKRTGNENPPLEQQIQMIGQMAKDAGYKGMLFKWNDTYRVDLWEETVPEEHKKETQEGSRQDLIKKAKEYKTKNTFIRSQGVTLYHGGRKEFKSAGEINIPLDEYTVGFFLSTSKDVAEVNAFGGTKTGKTGAVTEFVVDLKNPYVVDAKEEFYLNIPVPEEMRGDVIETLDTVDADNIAEWAYENGYDGAIIKNVMEGKGASEVGDTYVVFNKNSINTKAELEEIWEETKISETKTGEQDYREIIESLGLKYDGTGLGLVNFTDPKTNGSLAVKIKDFSAEAVQAKVEASRKAFKEGAKKTDSKESGKKVDLSAWQDEKIFTDPEKTPINNEVFAIVTATRGVDAGSARNVRANLRMERDIQEKGWAYTKIDGWYREVFQGTSFIIHGVPEKEVVEWSKPYSQESIIVNRGAVNMDKKTLTPYTGKVYFGKQAEEKGFYSIIEIKGKKISFSMDIDWELAIPDLKLRIGAKRPSISGDAVTAPSTTYDQATQKKEGGKNLWVRQSNEQTNKDRILVVQFSLKLFSTGEEGIADQYYNKLYDERKGYERLPDFWEVPMWHAQVAALYPKTDVYVVRDMDEARKFLHKAHYDKVAFSALDINKGLVKDLAKANPGQTVIGGYINMSYFDGVNNIKRYDSMDDFAKDLGVEYKEYTDYSHYVGSKVIARLALSTGCLHHCSFCTVPDQVVEVDQETVNQQVEAILDLDSDLVYLNDKTFGQAQNYKDLPEIYKVIKKEKPNFIGFIIQTTPAQMNKFSDDYLKRSGIKYIELGVETFNDPILKELHKPATEEIIERAVDKIRKNDIWFIPNIVIGFDGETKGTYQRTLDFLKGNADIISHMNIYNLAIYEGTELAEKLEVKMDEDQNERAIDKSFHKDKEIHEWFSKEVHTLGEKSLDKIPGQPEISLRLRDPGEYRVINPFLNITKMSLYDEMLGNPEYFKEKKGLTFVIAYMAPETYERLISKYFWQNNMTEKEKDSYGSYEAYLDYMKNKRTEQPLVDKYYEMTSNGSPMPMPVIEFNKKGYMNQEGHHRAKVAMRMKMDRMPVMIVTSTEENAFRPNFMNEPVEVLKEPRTLYERILMPHHDKLSEEIKSLFEATYEKTGTMRSIDISTWNDETIIEIANNKKGIQLELDYDAFKKNEWRLANALNKIITGTNIIPVINKGDLDIDGSRVAGRVLVTTDTPNPVNYVMMHEVMHELQKRYPGEYNRMRKHVMRNLNITMGELLDLYRDRHGALDPDTDYINEFVNDYVAQQSMEISFWKDISRKAPRLAQKIVEIIGEFLEAIKSVLRNTRNVEKYLNRRRQMNKMATDLIAKAISDEQTAINLTLKEELDYLKRHETNTDTKEFKTWFKKSAVKEPVYHGTRSLVPFTVFGLTNTIGYHFGAIEQAEEILFDGMQDSWEYAKEDAAAGFAELVGHGVPRIMPVWLSIQNPLRMKDLNVWPPSKILEQLLLDGHIEKERFIRIRESMSKVSVDKKHEILRGLIKSLGYDGIVYLNRVEGAEAGPGPFSTIENMTDEQFKKKNPMAKDSYIAFDKTQIKSVYNFGGWGLEEDDIRYRMREAPMTPEMKEWLKDSKVQKVVYHGTYGNEIKGEGVPIHKFQTKEGKRLLDTGSLGAHFGTADQASLVTTFNPHQLSGQNIIPAYINIKNPIRLRDEGTWQLNTIAKQLEELGLISEKEREEASKAFWDEKPTPSAQPLLKKLGYDGVIYLNRYEVGGRYLTKEDRITDEEFLKIHPDAEDSYIVFEPNQVKSIYNQAPTDSPDIMLRKRIDQETDKLKKKISNPNSGNMERHRARTIIKNNIKFLIRGYRIGKIDKEYEIKDLQTKVRDYAQKYLPQDEITRGQVTQLLTKMRNANNVRGLQEAFQKVLEIESKVRDKQLRRKIRQLLDKTKPRKDRGKIAGTTVTADTYSTLDKIREIIELSEEKAAEIYENIFTKIVNTEQAQIDVEEDQSREIYLVGTFSDLNHKTGEDLERAYNDIKDLIETGRMKHDYIEDMRKEKFGAHRAEAVREITGHLGVVNEMEARRLGLDTGKKESIIKRLDNWNMSWEFILDKIKKTKTGLMQGFLANYYGNLVHESRNAENKWMREKFEMINEKLEDLYGLTGGKLAKKLEETTIRRDTGITLKDKTHLAASDGELAKKLIEYRDPTLRETFNNMGYDDEIMEKIQEILPPELIEFAEWQLYEFYPMLYDEINEAFSTRFHVNLPFNPFYSPIYRAVLGGEKVDEMMETKSPYASVLNGHLKSRIKNTIPLRYIDINTVLSSHVLQMGHFMAWVNTMQELRGVLGSKVVQAAVLQHHGKSALEIINTFMDDFARGSVDRAMVINFWDKLRSNFTKAVIGMNPTVFFKQLASIPAYAMDLTNKQFIGGMIDFFSNPIGNSRVLMQSETMKARYHVGFERDIILALKRENIDRLAGVKKFTDALMTFTKLGDAAAILIGGWGVYKYHLQQKLDQGWGLEPAKKFALNKFERATKRAQQAGDVEDLSALQRKGSGWKLFTMFMTSKNQYFRHESAAIRNILQGKGNWKQNVKIVAITHFILPMLFQFIASGFRFEREKQVRAAILGSFNGILVAGELMEELLNALFGEISFGQVLPVLSSKEDVMQAVYKLRNPEELEIGDVLKAFDNLASGVSKTAGVPYDPASRMAKGWADILTGRSRNPLRAFGFSRRMVGEDHKENISSMLKIIKKRGPEKELIEGYYNYLQELLDRGFIDHDDWKRYNSRLKSVLRKRNEKK